MACDVNIPLYYKAPRLRVVQACILITLKSAPLISIYMIICASVKSYASYSDPPSTRCLPLTFRAVTPNHYHLPELFVRQALLTDCAYTEQGMPSEIVYQKLQFGCCLLG